MFGGLMSDDPLVSAGFYVAAWLLFTLILIRFGLLAVVTLWFVRNLLWWPMTPDLSAWYADTGLMALAVIAALATYGFIVSLGKGRLAQT
jgi:hypothetical protein